MEYLKVKNLRRYQHYKNRNITSWIKVVCNILDDPDMVHLDDIDRWRWIGIIVLATKNKNQLPKNADWISSRISNSNSRPMSVSIDKYVSLGWLKVYTRSIRSIDKVYPDLKDLKDLKDLSNKQATPALKAAFIKIYNKGKGINLYSLINRIKKDMGQPGEWRFPGEVLLRVCEAYDKEKVKEPWPWFVKVLKEESALWHAQQQIEANDKSAGFPSHIREVLGIK